MKAAGANTVTMTWYKIGALHRGVLNGIDFTCLDGSWRVTYGDSRNNGGDGNPRMRHSAYGYAPCRPGLCRANAQCKARRQSPESAADKSPGGARDAQPRSASPAAASPATAPRRWLRSSRGVTPKKLR